MCDSCEAHAGGRVKEVNVYKSLFEENYRLSLQNRELFNRLGAKVINLISSPGAGKTTLLEKTIDLLNGYLIGVIEGDIETDFDAQRIRKKGIPVVQITTGGACHLDARLINRAIRELQNIKDHYDLIFIENVGNLVCPSSFYLGEDRRVTLLSVTEGSDKPAKYPKTFITSDCMIITKLDVINHFDFSIDDAINHAKRLNPHIHTISLSSFTGEGLNEWISYLRDTLGETFVKKFPLEPIKNF